MSTKTIGKVPSDVLHFEQNARYSREALTIAVSQTIVVGSVLRKTDAGDIVLLSANVNEVQTLNFAGAPTGGVFTIQAIDKDGVEQTSNPITYSATIGTLLTNINAALDLMFGAGLVVASGTVVTAVAITFSGAGYLGIAQELVDIDSGGLTGGTTPHVSVTRTTSGSGADADNESDDAQIVGVALADVTTDASVTQKIPVCVRDAIVKKNGLSYGTATFALVEAALNKLGIIVRTDV